MRGVEHDLIECGNIWDLDEETLIYKDIIRDNASKRQIEEEDWFNLKLK